jgi:hypothetical protein
VGTVWDGDLEAARGARDEVARHLQVGREYTQWSGCTGVDGVPEAGELHL